MISFAQPIADAYVSPSRNIALPSTPGRQVRFLQGHAVIKDGRDLVALMKRPEVKIVLLPHALSWADQFVAAAGNVRAEIIWPEAPPAVVVDPPVAPPLIPQMSWDPAIRLEYQQQPPEDDDGPDSQGADT